MATRPGGKGKAGAVVGRWHAVSVKPGPNPCDAANSAKTRRWLSREAPLLPLPDCTRPDSCRCTYQHHEDRREGGRRAEDMDAFSTPPRSTVERRSRRERRQQSDE